MGCWGSWAALVDQLQVDGSSECAQMPWLNALGLPGQHIPGGGHVRMALTASANRPALKPHIRPATVLRLAPGMRNDALSHALPAWSSSA